MLMAMSGSYPVYRVTVIEFIWKNDLFSELAPMD